MMKYKIKFSRFKFNEILLFYSFEKINKFLKTHNKKYLEY